MTNVKVVGRLSKPDYHSILPLLIPEFDVERCHKA